MEGTLPDDRRVLVVWRNRPGDGDDGKYEDERCDECNVPGSLGVVNDPAPGPPRSVGIDKENAVLDAWFEQRGYAHDGSDPAAGSVPDVVFVNGDCSLLSLRPRGATWDVQLTEEHFLRLMFEPEG